MTARDSELSDSAAVRAVIDGRKEDYAILVRRYQDILYRHALRMVGEPDEAADIVQTAFIKGFEQLASCDPERVGAWLFRIGANQCRDYLKNPRRKNVELTETLAPPGEGEDPEGTAHRGELMERINQALDRLPPDEREAFVLKHIEGLPYKDISGLLEASIPALKMRVHRARESLQELLEEYR